MKAWWIVLVLLAPLYASAQSTRPANWVEFDFERGKRNTGRMAALLFTNPELWGKVMEANETLNSFRVKQLQGDFASSLGAKTGPLYPGGVAFPGFSLMWIKLVHAEKYFKQFHGEESFEYAEFLNDLGNGYSMRDDYGDNEIADHRLTRAKEILDKVCGDMPHPMHGLVLSNLGLVKVKQRDYAQARPLMSRGAEILRKTRGEGDPMLWLVRQNLAETYLEEGNWATARQLLDDAEAGLRKTIEQGQGSKFERLRVLGYVLINQSEVDAQTGSFVRQRQRLREALVAITEMEKMLNSKATMQRAIVLFSLGYSATRDADSTAADLTEAEKSVMESRDILGNLAGKHHPQYAGALEALAGLYLRRDGEGDRARVPGLIEQAIQIRRNLGKDSIDPGSWVKLKIEYFRLEGMYKEAADLAKKYAEYLTNGLGATHPETLAAKLALARLLDATGESAAAQKVLVESLAAVRERMDVTFAVQSEKEQLRMTRVYRQYLDALLSRPSGETVQKQAMAWKGAVFRRQRLLRTMRSTDRALFDELGAASARLGALVRHRESHPEAIPQRDDEMASLTRRVEDIEAKIARLTRGVDEVADVPKLPEGAALVDFHRYCAVRPPAQKNGKWIEEDRYVAFVRCGERTQVVDLGPAEPIENALAAWRDRQRFGIEHGRKLRELVWRPIEAALEGRISVVLISPDGALGTLPFAALPAHDDGGGYLIEKYAFAALPMPAMLASTSPAKRGDGMLVVGEVDFDHGASSAVATPAAIASQALRARSGERWERLPGAAAEVTDVIGIFDGRVDKLTGGAASREAFVTHAPGKQFVHLATHGFFTPRADDSAIDPGMLSGVCLAGANASPRLAIDGAIFHGGGILTAAEVAQIDLRGTQTVVLSACETGLGMAAGGEGLLGLQRAFQIAGVQNVVASLWKVDDGATRELMRRFYRQMIDSGKSPVAVLRQAQLEMLRQGGGATGQPRGTVSGGDTVDALHPSLWAAWVVSGDVGDLDALVAETRRPFVASAVSVTKAQQRRSAFWKVVLTLLVVAVIMLWVWHLLIRHHIKT